MERSSASRAQIDPDVFATPGREWRSVTLWMLNDRLEHERLTEQLHLFKEAGWGAVIPRTFWGLDTIYLSEEFMDAMEFLVEEAGRVGLKVWLQAGYMPGAIPDWPVEHAMEVLRAVSHDQEMPEDARVVARTDGLTCVAEVRPHYVDVLDPDAVHAYLDAVYRDAWFDRLGDEFGKTIEGVWGDEPSFPHSSRDLPQVPWGESLLNEFEDRWDYDLSPHAAQIFAREGTWERTRYHYRHVLEDLFGRAYFRSVHDWCDKHGVKFTGHLMAEDTLASQTDRSCCAMPFYKHMHVPGIDHLTSSLRWPRGYEDGARFIVTPRQCSSAADQNGQERVLAEMYGVTSNALSFAGRRRIGDWLALHGVNFPCMHGSYLSLRGRRKRKFPLHMSEQQPWWPDNRIAADYFARMNYALTRGQRAAEVLVLHPVESAWCLVEPTGEGTGDVDAMNRAFERLSEHLEDACVEYDYGDEQMLSETGEVKHGRLHLGRKDYGLVLLPDCLTLRCSTVGLLERFRDAGGRVLRVGSPPRLIEGEAGGERLEKVLEHVRCVANEPDALRAAVRRAVRVDVEIETPDARPSDVLVHQRRLDQGVLLFILNTADERENTVCLRAEETGSFQQWDCTSGQATELSPGRDGVLRLRFQPWESCLLQYRPGARPTVSPRSRRKTRSVDLDGQWAVKRKDPNALTLDYCRLRRGDGGFGPRVPIIAVKQILQEDDPYEGPLTIRQEFEIEDVPDTVSLAFEDPDRWSVRLNGVDLDTSETGWWRDRSFRTVDIADQVQSGTNVVEFSGMFDPLGSAEFGLAGLFATLRGAEVECAYVIGDFAVSSGPSDGPPQPGCIRLGTNPRIVTESPLTDGDLVRGGYPFYSGRLALEQGLSIRALEPDERAVLHVPGLRAAVSHVRLNGREAGVVPWAPWKVDVTEVLRPGGNTVQLELATGLRNLLGPHHRRQGERCEAWGEQAWSGRWDKESGTGYEQWYLPENRTEDTRAWTDDYFFVEFGLTEAPRLDLVEERNAD